MDIVKPRIAPDTYHGHSWSWLIVAGLGAMAGMMLFGAVPALIGKTGMAPQWIIPWALACAALSPGGIDLIGTGPSLRGMAGAVANLGVIAIVGVGCFLAGSWLA